jgi:hypothetical protein
MDFLGLWWQTTVICSCELVKPFDVYYDYWVFCPGRDDDYCKDSDFGERGGPYDNGYEEEGGREGGQRANDELNGEAGLVVLIQGKYSFPDSTRMLRSFNFMAPDPVLDGDSDDRMSRLAGEAYEEFIEQLILEARPPRASDSGCRVLGEDEGGGFGLKSAGPFGLGALSYSCRCAPSTKNDLDGNKAEDWRDIPPPPPDPGPQI